MAPQLFDKLSAALQGKTVTEIRLEMEQFGGSPQERRDQVEWLNRIALEPPEVLEALADELNMKRNVGRRRL